MATLNLTDFRKRIGELRGREYWRSLEELDRSGALAELLSDEFPRHAAALSDSVDRRAFLKLMGASAALAGLTACQPPAETIVPYVQQPENFIPGKPLFFASSMVLNGYATGVLVESHLGRPTKIEGNPEHPSSLGASDAFMQASILGLYDPDRSQVVRHLGDTSTWTSFIAALQPVLAAARANGSTLRLLTQSITSPSLGAQIDALLNAVPGVRWHQWDAVTRDHVREGSRMAFGAYLHPIYDFERANVVVSLGGDFTCDGPGHLRYARGYARRRRVREGAEAAMNRLYLIESTPSPLAAVCDHRVAVKPSEIESYARAIAAGIGIGGGAAVPAQRRHWIAALVRDLERNRGASIVIAGEEQPAAVHALAHAINDALGNLGSTVTIIDSPEVRPVNQTASIGELVADMNSGMVQALVMIGGNPVFDAPADLQFGRAAAKVPFRAHLSLYYDETSLLSHWHVPETHYLETWGDARAHDGTVSLMQPLIAPLYNGRSSYEVLSVLLGSDSSAYDVVRRHWFAHGATEETWRKWVHDGVITGSAFPPRAARASRSVAPERPAPAGGIELELKHDPSIYDGRFANNAWLQELPKPLTKITWDNFVILSPETAERLGYTAEKRAPLANELLTRLADVTYRGKTLRLPIWVVPGQPDDTATVYFGYGRERAGRVGDGAGFNVYPFRFSDALHGGPGVRVALDTASKPFPIACTQEHQSLDPGIVGERGIIRSATHAEYQANPRFAQEPHHGVAAEQHGDESMYPAFVYDGYAWGMAIDTSICTGCNGCVIACQSENNIPVVGKDEVVREREMNWLRIDRYYRGSGEDLEIYHQPVPCMHCETAPCEPVCPTEATTHSPDGLNEMTYNRCVGTRYCSNNCPYKVRRFNFFEYADWKTESLQPMRNPDVTVRSRGVMEKCTFCVQRIRAGMIEAEKQGRRVRDGEIVTACAQACPTQAIVFGDINDRNSEVARLKRQPTNYELLGELNTKPRTTYLAAIRNPNPELETTTQGGGRGE